MLKAKSFVRQTTTGTGVGALAMDAVDGRKTFGGAFPDSDADNLFYYIIFDPDTLDTEEGEGYEQGGALYRVNVIESTNDDELVNFGEGEKSVTCDIPAKLQATAQTMPIDE